MKKKILAVILASALCLTVTACGASATSENVPAVSEETSVQTEEDTSFVSDDSSASDDACILDELPEYDSEEEKFFAIYYDVLIDAFNVIYYEMEPMHHELVGLLYDAIGLDTDEKSQFGFGFYDINSDGITELVVARKQQEGEFNSKLYAIGNYNCNGAYLMLGNTMFTTLEILENGNAILQNTSEADNIMFHLYEYATTEYVSRDIYFSQYSEDFEGVAFYHNEKGVWNAEESEQITEAEYNFYAEVGLEAINFDPALISFATYQESFGPIDSDGIDVGEIALEDVTWSLYSYDDGEYHFAEDEGLIQNINFVADEMLAGFYTNRNGVEYSDIGSFYPSVSGLHKVVVSIHSDEFSLEYLNVIDFTLDGKLMCQRIVYEWDTGEMTVVNEYYIKSFG